MNSTALRDEPQALLREQHYISANRSAYDALAGEYRKRAVDDLVKDIPLVAPFVSYLKPRFGERAQVLDIGPGNGVNLAMLHEAGFAVTGIDISPEMLKIAGELCPTATLYLGDFLTVEFPERSFHGVFAKASLHLLPKTEAMRAFRKIHKILVTDGLFYVTTTAASDSAEGYFTKDDYPGRLPRFRKHWTPAELLDSVSESGFRIYRDSYDVEADWGKRWFNVWAIKN